jgi:[ribosomal protein S5]-alanine N-acetyltransferase
MHLPSLTTDRLVLRPFHPDDLDVCLEILHKGDPGASDDCATWLRWQIATYRQKERMHQPPYGDRAVVLLATGEVVGVAGLVPSLVPLTRDEGGYAFAAHALPEVGLYYELAPAARGQGYATEVARALCAWAFTELNLARIVATTTHDNFASRGVMERLGMEILIHDQPEPHWLQVVGVLGRPRRGG